mmetsp:Transcript_65008/g.201490  ORF Transcript_65008/g.201490 Transcript_65008/m.201490 type:complete len:321 (+) Transcript_65008:1223-2185(+)
MDLQGDHVGRPDVLHECADLGGLDVGRPQPVAVAAEPAAGPAGGGEAGDAAVAEAAEEERHRPVAALAVGEEARRAVQVAAERQQGPAHAEALHLRPVLEALAHALEDLPQPLGAALVADQAHFAQVRHGGLRGGGVVCRPIPPAERAADAGERRLRGHVDAVLDDADGLEANPHANNQLRRQWPRGVVAHRHGQRAGEEEHGAGVVQPVPLAAGKSEAAALLEGVQADGADVRGHGVGHLGIRRQRFLRRHQVRQDGLAAAAAAACARQGPHLARRAEGLLRAAAPQGRQGLAAARDAGQPAAAGARHAHARRARAKMA